MSTTKPVGYVRLGNSGLKVSKIILGCMGYGSPEWHPWILGEQECIEHVKAAYDLGINTFDTANVKFVYSNGLGEVVLGNAIKKLGLPREEIVVMTKIRGAVGKTPDVSAWELYVAGPDNMGYVNQHGLSRKHIFAGVRDSLKRLQLDYIDVLQCHRVDNDTPISETMEALHDVVKAGLVRYIGMSSCYAWQFHAMQNYALAHNLTPFISMQNQYSLVYREEEREMMPTLRHFGVGSIPWSPLAQGLLTRPYRDRDAAEANSAQTQRQATADYLALGRGNRTVVQRVEEIAAKHGAIMAQISLAWVMSKDEVTAPVVGSSSIEKLKDLVGALDIQLSPEDIKYLEEPYTPMAIMSH
ncbi:Aldo/keto reductase [Mycena sanguinolenta]|uniref:Aldo/keto reductase n=1 Tax=Mycena sanguinolenta TaxID=230812 RepID=A0A8H6Z9P4_9AGAR|nr:Aldo/keto reductase [Mycena sanguinolenta]